jgi:hypothetical protein
MPSCMRLAQLNRRGYFSKCPLVVFARFFALFLNLAGDDGLLRDPDSLSHIGVGREIVQTGSFPRNCMASNISIVRGAK